MAGPSLLVGWPPNSAVVLVEARDGEILASEGDLDSVVPWASVTKFLVALAMARAVGEQHLTLDQPVGPEGSTIKHLLAHASGLGLESSDPVTDVGVRRIYSNVGIDLAVQIAATGREWTTWLPSMLDGVDLSGVKLEGRASSGASGSLRSLGTLARAWFNDEVIERDIFALFTSTFLAQLAGVVPGFGRFDPCAWGLGPEIHGTKNHWMGQRFSPRAFGHFGQSGVLVLVDPDHDVIVAAAASAPFGPWARQRWPQWSDEIFDRCVAT